MKNVKLSFLSIFAFLFSLTIYAQIKKPIGKPKTKPELVTKQLILGQDIEEVTLKLDEILSRNGFIFDKVTDENIYFFELDGSPTKNVQTYKRILDLQNDLHIILTANQDSKVYDVSIYSFTNQNFKTEEVKLLSFLNFKNWLVRDQNLYETVFSLGQNILTTNKQYLRINAFIPDATEFYSENYPEINIDSLNIETPIEKVHLFMLQKLKKANIKLICVKQNEIENDKANNFFSYTINSIYTQGINLSIKSDKIQKKEIYISSPNPIVFNNIKKTFFDNSAWTSQYTFKRNSGQTENYFKYKNFITIVNNINKTIKFLIVPTDNESAKKIMYGKPLSLVGVLEVYNGFENQDAMMKYMRDFYYHDGTSPNEAYSFFKNAQKIKILFGDGIENWGFKFLVDSEDNTINKEFKNTLANIENITSADWKLDDGTFRTQFYDTNIYNNAKAEHQRQKEINQEKQRQEEAERKEAEIERRLQQQRDAQAAEIERAEKARRTEASMRELNGAMQNLINAYTKKP